MQNRHWVPLQAVRNVLVRPRGQLHSGSPLFYSQQSLSGLLGLSPRRVVSLICRTPGDLPAVKLGYRRILAEGEDHFEMMGGGGDERKHSGPADPSRLPTFNLKPGSGTAILAISALAVPRVPNAPQSTCWLITNFHVRDQLQVKCRVQPSRSASARESEGPGHTMEDRCRDSLHDDVFASRK